MWSVQGQQPSLRTSYLFNSSLLYLLNKHHLMQNKASVWLWDLHQGQCLKKTIPHLILYYISNEVQLCFVIQVYMINVVLDCSSQNPNIQETVTKWIQNITKTDTESNQEIKIMDQKQYFNKYKCLHPPAVKM